MSDKLRVLVKADNALFLCPGHSLLKLCLIVNAVVHTANDLNLVHRLNSHSEIILNKVGVNDRAGNTHTDRADLKIGLASHRCRRNSRASEAEKLLLNVLRNRGVVHVLNLVTVNAKRRQTLLCMTCKHRRKINRAGSLSTVKAPNALDGQGIHVHSLRAVAPAGSNGKGDVNALTAELLRTRRRLCNTADSGVGDNDLYRLAVRVFEIVGEKLSRALRHIHSLILERLAHAKRSASAVDSGAYTDNGILSDKS